MRADGNQAKIVKDLRSIGASVLILSQVGNGCPDLLVGFRGKNYLLEVKTAKGKVSEVQRKFMSSWAGQAEVIRDLKEALDVVARNKPESKRKE